MKNLLDIESVGIEINKVEEDCDLFRLSLIGINEISTNFKN